MKASEIQAHIENTVSRIAEATSGRPELVLQAENTYALWEIAYQLAKINDEGLPVENYTGERIG